MNKVDTARAGIPATAQVRYLNTANIGPITRTYARALATATESDLLTGRAVDQRWEAISRATDALRREIAVVLGCAPENILLTTSTSDGLRRVIESVPWQRGDEVVSTSIEHDTCNELLEQRVARHGVVRKVATLPEAPVSDIGWLTDLLSRRTRLIAVSAVAFEAGTCLPVEAIATAARAAGVPLLLDAAQCAGAAPLDIAAIGPDYCALPLRKWLCGPEGLGAVYVKAPASDQRLSELRGGVPFGRGIFEATVASLAWMRETFGWPWIFERTQSLARYARRAVEERDDLEVLGSPPFAGITTIRCPAAGSPQATALLARDGFLVRHLPALRAFRVSTAFFNTEDEIDSLIAMLEKLSSTRRHGDRQ